MKKRQSYQSRVREMKNKYQNSKKGINFKWAVIHCYFRKGLTLADTAEVLNTTEERVSDLVDALRQ